MTKIRNARVFARCGVNGRARCLSTERALTSSSPVKGRQTMATSQSKRSHSPAQSRAKNPASHTTQTQKKKTARRRRRHKLPRLPPPVITRRGKTTIRRFDNRVFYRMEEVKGKMVDYVEFFTAGENHSLDIRFQDKTTLHFVIDPGFTLETEYADLKSGDWRSIKRWPLVRSRSLHG